MKISKGVLKYFPKIHEIYETFKHENYITHLYVWRTDEIFHGGFIAERASERISEIGQYLRKLW